MSYGLAAGMIGAHDGYRAAKQDQRQAKQDELWEKRYGLQMEADQHRLDTSRADATYQGEVRGRQREQWEQQDQALVQRDQVNQALARWSVQQDPGGLFDLHEQAFGSRPSLSPDGQAVSYLENGKPKDMPINEYLNMAANMATDDGFLQAINADLQARREAAAAEAEHGRNIELEHVKQGEWQPDAAGNTAFRMPGDTFQAPPEGLGGANATALERNTAHYMRAFAMDERTATLAASGRLRPGEAEEQARTVAMKFIDPSDPMSARLFIRQNQDLAEGLGITAQTEPVQMIQKLTDHFAEQFSSQISFDGYGIADPAAPPTGGSPSGGAPPPANPATTAGDGSSARSPLDAASLTSAPPAGTFIRIAGRSGVRDGVYKVESNGDIRRVGE